MFCTNCGSQAAETARFCPRCGAPLNAAQAPQAAPAAPPYPQYAPPPPAYAPPPPAYAPYAPQPAAARGLPKWAWIAGIVAIVAVVLAVLAITGVFDPNSALYGTWNSEEEGLSLQFKRGGTVVVDQNGDQNVAVYEFTGNGRMVLTPPEDMGGQPITFLFDIEDDTLTMTSLEWNDTIVLFRVK